MIVQVVPVIEYSVRSLCSKEYPNHPHGCPNFGKRDTCPPKALFWDKVVDHPSLALLFITDLTLKNT